MTDAFPQVDYDAIAGTYDRRYLVNDYSGIETALLAFVGQDLRARVLEVGCGTGHWLEVLAGCGARTAGLDASERMLVHGRARLPGVPLVNGLAEQLPLVDGKFDRVFFINAFHHVADKAGALAEARRVLRPGGGLMTVGLDPHLGIDRWYVYEYFEPVIEIDRRRYPASSSIREWLQALRFADVRTREVQHLPARLPARAAIERGHLDRGATSQLSVLTDAQYEQGMDRIRQAMERAESKGESLYLVADLRLYATYGSAR